MNYTTTIRLKKSGVINWLMLVIHTMKNWYMGWMFFLPNFIINIISIFLEACIFYYMGQVASVGMSIHLEEYGIDYSTYIITGLMLNLIMKNTLECYHQACLRGYWTNQFDVYLQHPGGISAHLVGDVFVQYILTFIKGFIYLIIGILLFNIPFSFNHILDISIIILLTILGLTGLGLVSASTFSLLNAKQWGNNPVSWFIGFSIALFSGIYFPPSILPTWMQNLSHYLPQTHALHITRLFLNNRAELGDYHILANITYLIKFACISMPLGLIIFSFSLYRAQRNGNLTRWA